MNVTGFLLSFLKQYGWFDARMCDPVQFANDEDD